MLSLSLSLSLPLSLALDFSSLVVFFCWAASIFRSMHTPPFFHTHTYTTAQTHHTRSHTWFNPLDTVFPLVFCCVFFLCATFPFFSFALIIYCEYCKTKNNKNMRPLPVAVNRENTLGKVPQNLKKKTCAFKPETWSNNFRGGGGKNPQTPFCVRHWPRGSRQSQVEEHNLFVSRYFLYLLVQCYLPRACISIVGGLVRWATPQLLSSGQGCFRY